MVLVLVLTLALDRAKGGPVGTFRFKRDVRSYDGHFSQRKFFSTLNKTSLFSGTCFVQEKRRLILVSCLLCTTRG